MNKAKEILYKHAKSDGCKSDLLRNPFLEQAVLNAINEALTIPAVSKSLPDHYAGELNTNRIKTYRMLNEQYNLGEGTVRDIFCKGADWYKEQCQKGIVR